jgi:glycosyltransferase involved in cell wall biosynthesis
VTTRPAARWPRRILHVTPVLWSGAGAALVRLAEAQRQAGASVTVVTAHQTPAGGDWPAFRQRLIRAGVRLDRVDFFSREPAAFWASVDRLASVTARDRPALVHTHAGVPACAMAVLRDRGEAHGAAVVAHLNSWGPGRPPWMDRMDAWGMRRADRVVCISRAYAARLIELGADRRRMHYVPWGVELPQPSDLPAVSSPVFGFVGRIEPRKRQHMLVEALAEVRQQVPEARLELVGPVADEAYAAALDALVAALGLEEAVTRFGRVGDVLPHLRGWAAFVSASADEGQGLAVLEAMAAGVPVIAARARGIEDYLDRRTGALVLRATARALGREVVHVLTQADAARRRASAARALVQRRYGWPVCLAALQSIYRRARVAD